MMGEEKFDFGQINNKLVYSLSFILILWGLKDFVISWFPENFSIKLFGFILTIRDIVSLMILILFVSIYLYGINYLISNPLNKVKRYINGLASILWFIFFIFPIFIIVVLFFKNLFSSAESLTTFISLIFGLLGILMSSWSQKQSREMDLLIFDKQIEILKSKPLEKNKTTEFLRHHSILEYLIKRALVEKIKIPVDYNKSTNLAGAANILLVSKFITPKTKETLLSIWQLRNKIVHEEYKVSEKEVQQIKDAIKELDFDLKEK